MLTEYSLITLSLMVLSDITLTSFTIFNLKKKIGDKAYEYELNPFAKFFYKTFNNPALMIPIWWGVAISVLLYFINQQEFVYYMAFGAYMVLNYTHIMSIALIYQKK